MPTVINLSQKRTASDTLRHLPECLRRFLPLPLRIELESICSEGYIIDEIRLRSGRRAYLTVADTDKQRKNLMLCFQPDGDLLADLLNRMCDGSLYAYSESIINGFISLGDGVRVGVCGRASVKEGRILGVYAVSALNIRLPCLDAIVDSSLIAKIRRCVLQGGGVLIYSAPSGGKTTLLRSVARALASGPEAMRIAIVDTREELSLPFGDSTLSIDTLVGYPKAEGIRIATAFMNPQVIICDEIGELSEARAIADAQNCGVPLIATAHGKDLGSIMKREGMRVLHSRGIFSAYIGISSARNMRFEYGIVNGEEIELENIGGASYLS